MKYLLTIFLILLLSQATFAQSLTWQQTSPDYTINATPGNGYMLMTNSRPASLNLPDNPSDGDAIGFMDVSGTFSSNPLTVDPGSIPIDGNRGTKVYNTADVSTTLVYSSSPYGWKTLSGGSTATPTISSVTDFGAVGDATTDNTAAFNDALRENDELFIPSGTFKISGTVSIPSGKKLVFANGGVLDITGELIGNHSIIQAGMHQLFTPSSNLTGTWNVPSAYVEWFGAKGDGTGTNDMAAFEQALQVFCKPVEYTEGGTLRANGTAVHANGAMYIVEQTLQFPQYGILIMGKHTLILGATTDFFDTYVNIKREPFHLEGGQFLIRRYDEQDGWSGSAQDWSAKVQYAYNENPVIRLYLERETWTESYVDKEYSTPSILRGFNIRPTAVYGELNRQPLAYDGIVITSDTSEVTVALEIGRQYYITDYQTGDDFVNVGGTNVTGSNFTATGTTPTTWTNNSIIRKTSNASYYNIVEDIYMYKADTGIYMQGDSYSGMINSWHFDKMGFDACVGGAIVLGNRSEGHVFENTFIQPYTNQTYGIYPTIDIAGRWNSIRGMMWDIHLDSTVLLQSTAYHNTVDLNLNNLREKYTVEYGYKASNSIGSHPIWNNAKDDSYYGYYWANARNIGIGTYNNWNEGGLKMPRGVLSVIGQNSTPATPPMLVEGTQASGGSGSLDNTSSWYNTLMLTTHSTTTGNLAKGFGTRIGFYGRKGSGTVTTPFQMGAFGMKLETSNDTLNTAFSWFNKSAGTTTLAMTLRSTGRLGIGTSNPSYTLDLTADGTFQSDNILDDGSTVEISSPIELLAAISLAGNTTFYDANQTADTSQLVYNFNATANRTVNLPSLSSTIGEAYIINNASPTYTVTIDPNGTDKIQGITSGTYVVPASSVVWVWDSKIALGGWFVIIKSTP